MSQGDEREPISIETAQRKARQEAVAQIAEPIYENVRQLSDLTTEMLLQPFAPAPDQFGEIVKSYVQAGIMRQVQDALGAADTQGQTTYIDILKDSIPAAVGKKLLLPFAQWVCKQDTGNPQDFLDQSFDAGKKRIPQLLIPSLPDEIVSDPTFDNMSKGRATASGFRVDTHDNNPRVADGLRLCAPVVNKNGNPIPGISVMYFYPFQTNSQSKPTINYDANHPQIFIRVEPLTHTHPGNKTKSGARR